jgi:hypothetical protein
MVDRDILGAAASFSFAISAAQNGERAVAQVTITNMADVQLARQVDEARHINEDEALHLNEDLRLDEAHHPGEARHLPEDRGPDDLHESRVKRKSRIFMVVQRISNMQIRTRPGFVLISPYAITSFSVAMLARRGNSTTPWPTPRRIF